MPAFAFNHFVWVLLAVLIALLVWWAMWREDFDGMRKESQIRKRPQLSFDEFYAQFYADSEIPRSTIARILDITSEQFGIPVGYIRLEDNFLQTNLADTMYYVIEFAEEFDLPRSRQNELAELDGTFDNIVRHIAHQPRFKE